MSVDVSLCVVVGRGPRGLARLVESVGRLKRPDGARIELIVVETGPDTGALRVDPTPADCRVHWLAEPDPNAARARNRAVEVARGAWLAFLDDDAVLEEHWLEAYCEQMESADCDAFFGPVVPRLEQDVTHWLHPDVFYTSPRQVTGSAVDLERAGPANLLVRRILFRERSFDPAFASAGGEVVEFFRWWQRRGARFEWCDEAVAIGFVSPERHRPSWLLRRAFEQGALHARIERSLGRGTGRPLRVMRAATSGLVRLGLAALHLAAGRGSATRTALGAADRLGRAWAQLGLAADHEGSG